MWLVVGGHSRARALARAGKTYATTPPTSPTACGGLPVPGRAKTIRPSDQYGSVGRTAYSAIAAH